MVGEAYIPQELATKILLRLTDGSTIARFRSVNKQWLDLLSDSKFINRILWFDQDDDHEKKKQTQVLIRRHQLFGEKYRVRLAYSLLSYNDDDRTLTPLPPSKTTKPESEALTYQKIPMVPGAVRPKSYDWDRFKIVGCCDGIFCISDKGSNNRSPADIILWNPSTSETKILPTSPHIPSAPRSISWQQIGFGFDSKTRDYKVVRRCNYLQYFDPEPPIPSIVTDIYSLRNDSWKESHKPVDDINYVIEYSQPTRIVAQSRDSGRRRCYWYSDKCMASFDMIEETFDDVTHKRFSKKLKRCMKGCVTDAMHMQTTSNKEFMMTAIFGNSRHVYEIWGLLDYRKRGSWTKLFVVSKILVPDVRMSLGPLLGAADGTMRYLFVRTDGKLTAFDPETEDVEDDILGVRTIPKMWCHGCRGRNFEVGAYSYVPSRVSISGLVEPT
ncbi:F-box/kelch-repeat protein At3g06240 [Linum perenne]